MALATEHMPLLERLEKGANCVVFLDGVPEPAADVADMLRKAANEIKRLTESTDIFGEADRLRAEVDRLQRIIDRDDVLRSWNYRVIRHRDPTGDGVSYCIHECHYDKRGDAIPTSWTENPVDVSSETRSGLFRVLAVMIEAAAKPVLEIRDRKLVELEPAQE